MRKKNIFASLIGLALVWLSLFVSNSVYADAPLFRLYHSGLKVHLYTKSKNEYTVLGTRGWRQEGEAWLTSDEKGNDVYRLYHSGLRVHLYTKDKNEYAVLATRGWRQEGSAFRSHGSISIYRLYHTGLRRHLYTKDKNEYEVLAKRGWRQEGVAFYGMGKSRSQIVPKPTTTTKATAKPFTTTRIVTKEKPVTTTKATTKGKAVKTTRLSTTTKPVTVTKVLTRPEPIATTRILTKPKSVTTTKIITKVKPITTTQAVTKTKSATTTKANTISKSVTTTQVVTKVKPATTTQTNTTTIVPITPQVHTKEVNYKLTFDELVGANQYSPVQEVTVTLPEKTTINSQNNQVLSHEAGVTQERVMRYVLSSMYDFVEIADRKTSPLYHENEQHFHIILKKKKFDINAFIAEIKTKTPDERYLIATSAVASPVKYQREMTQDELNLIKGALDEKLYNQELLQVINQARAQVGVAALRLDEELAQGVKTRADEQGAEGFFRSIDTTGDDVGDKPHTRPNGENFPTAFRYLKTISLRNENAGQYLPEDIRELISERWQAEKQFKLLYSSTEHKNAMLYKGSNVAYFAMAFSDDHKMLISRKQQTNRTDVNGNAVIFIQIFGSKRAY